MHFHKQRHSDLISFYISAAKHVKDSGFEDEIEWQRTVSIETLTEGEFLSEVAWVILNSGFKESIIRPIFPKLSLCFCNWDSAQRIIEDQADHKDFQVGFLAINKKGEHGSYSIKEGFQYAINTDEQEELVDSKFVYSKS